MRPHLAQLPGRRDRRGTNDHGGHGFDGGFVEQLDHQHRRAHDVELDVDGCRGHGRDLDQLVLVYVDNELVLDHVDNELVLDHDNELVLEFLLQRWVLARHRRLQQEPSGRVRMLDSHVLRHGLSKHAHRWLRATLLRLRRPWDAH